MLTETVLTEIDRRAATERTRQADCESRGAWVPAEMYRDRARALEELADWVRAEQAAEDDILHDLIGFAHDTVSEQAKAS